MLGYEREDIITAYNVLWRIERFRDLAPHLTARSPTWPKY
jgi:hypothetical protein